MNWPLLAKSLFAQQGPRESFLKALTCEIAKPAHAKLEAELEWIRRRQRVEYMEKGANRARILERSQWVLDNLAGDYQHLNVVVVGGSSGKGSVCAGTSALLQQHVDVGTFYSPAFVSVSETVLINGRPVDTAILLEQLLVFKAQLDRNDDWKRLGLGYPSDHELMLAAALKVFCKAGCRHAVVEVGCGGRFDVANLLASKLVLLTHVGGDHVEQFGRAPDALAKEKAGLMPAQGTLITTETKPFVIDILREEASKRRADLIVLEQPVFIDDRNAALCEAGYRTITHQIEPASVSPAMSMMPARKQIIHAEVPILLDVAHSVDRICAIKQWLQGSGIKKVRLVISMAAEKDWRQCLYELDPLVEHYYLTLHRGGRTMGWPLPQVQAFVRERLQKKATLLTPWQSAVRFACDECQPGEAVLVTGSGHLSGQFVRSILDCIARRVKLQTMKGRQHASM